MTRREYDAVVIGSGPNGLSAAITLRQQGLSVLLLEGGPTIGGGLRSAELTLPGFVHDICSAIHPLAAGSPYFKTLPLQQHGLQFIYPPVAAAHPLANGAAAALYPSLQQTAQGLGKDEKAYLSLMKPFLKDWSSLLPAILGPLHFPKKPAALAQFGIKALQPATWLSGNFHTEKGRALWAGMAAHGIQPLSNPCTAAFALVLLTSGHAVGWPVVKGGSQVLADALASYFLSMGGHIETSQYVKKMEQLPSSHTVLFDVTPKQLMEIAGHTFSSFYQWQLKRYRYGMGVFKIDWSLAGAIPFTAPECRLAGTVHLGNTSEEIVTAEYQTARGRHPEQPFVLLAQPSLFDASRAPKEKHTAWAYCHVPNGSETDMTERIEKQVERFAPGFRELILGRHVMNARQVEAYNPNYVGGDINGGILDIRQLFTRPALRFSPYRTSEKGLYLCSSSTPPGGGVHGMCGYHAARVALKDVFNVRLPFEPVLS